jgi:hypothetical protein
MSNRGLSLSVVICADSFFGELQEKYEIPDMKINNAKNSLFIFKKSNGELSMNLIEID